MVCRTVSQVPDNAGLSALSPLIENHRRGGVDALLDAIASGCSTLLRQAPHLGAADACDVAAAVAGLGLGLAASASPTPPPPHLADPPPGFEPPAPAAARLPAPVGTFESRKKTPISNATGPGAGREFEADRSGEAAPPAGEEGAGAACSSTPFATPGRRPGCSGAR